MGASASSSSDSSSAASVVDYCGYNDHSIFRSETEELYEEDAGEGGGVWSILSFLKPEKLSMNMSPTEKRMYCNQEHNHDCGTACVRMVYSWAEEHFDPSEIQSITTPLWTIDLMGQLLRSSALKSEMYTLSVGFQDHHEEIGFYEQNMLHDKTRVMKLFKVCRLENWPVYEKAVSMKNFIQRLEGGYIAILLVNSKNISIQSYVHENDPDVYIGHFIVVIGYSRKFKMFIYLDPSRSGESIHCCSCFTFPIFVYHARLV